MYERKQLQFSGNSFQIPIFGLATSVRNALSSLKAHLTVLELCQFIPAARLVKSQASQDPGFWISGKIFFLEM